MLETAVVAVQWICLFYFVGVNVGYILLNLLSFLTLPRYMQSRVLQKLPQPHTNFEPPISLVVAAYNEETVIITAVRSLLQLNYPEFEIVIVNDGSKDRTLDVLIEAFALVKLPEAFRERLQHAPVRAVYQSSIYPEIRVIDKENGGAKSDAVNAGINGSRYPLFCPLDADTILERDSLTRLVQPFLDDPLTIASGGTVRIANGCEVSDGFMVKIGLPTNFVALFQIVEYLRAFLFGRIGWAAIDALPLISGAFGLFHKESVVAVGGYRHDTLGEDMELVLRLHRHFRLNDKPYKITYVADPVCWTEAPESLKVLKRQRVRWQRGLLESLMMNRELFFHRKSGFLGWLSLPFLLVFEGLGAAVEVLGYAVMIVCFLCGLISLKAFAAFMLVAVGLGLLLSFTALLLEEIAFHTYPKTKHLLVLFFIAVVENLGYRQITTLWRFEGLIDYVRKKEAKWGVMTRTATWAKTEAPPAAAATGKKELLPAAATNAFDGKIGDEKNKVASH